VKPEAIGDGNIGKQEQDEQSQTDGTIGDEEDRGDEEATEGEEERHGGSNTKPDADGGDDFFEVTGAERHFVRGGKAEATEHLAVVGRSHGCIINPATPCLNKRQAPVKSLTGACLLFRD